MQELWDPALFVSDMRQLSLNVINLVIQDVFYVDLRQTRQGELLGKAFANTCGPST